MADVNNEYDKRKRKRSTGYDVLAAINPDIQISDYKLVGQYLFDGEGEKVYVMEISINGKTFQGIGFSKKRARIMAAENVLISQGRLSKLSEEPHRLEDEPFNWNDFKADNVDKASALYFDFDDDNSKVCEKEDDDEWMESLAVHIQDDNQHLIGKNTISILSELHPDTTFKMISAIFEKQKIYFLMSTLVNGHEFKGSGPNKRLAKARAAREALKKLYKMEFGILEDGMPVYEGDEQIWRWYKQKLEERAMKMEFSTFLKNPLREINELYPDVKFSFSYRSDRPENDTKFIAQVQVEGKIYEGEGASKKLAKVKVAEVVINALMESGIYKTKMKEMEEKKRAKDIKKQSERSKFLLENFRSAVVKLNEMRPSIEYKVLAETPLKNTCITAFTVGVNIDGKDYVAVGKNKRMAKLEVAEKVLKDLGVWTEEDDKVKNRLIQELLESDNSKELYSITSQKGPIDLMKLVNEDMNREEMLKMIIHQLGLNLPSNLFNDLNNGRQLIGYPVGVSSVLDELDMLLESVLGQELNERCGPTGICHPLEIFPVNTEFCHSWNRGNSQMEITHSIGNGHNIPHNGGHGTQNVLNAQRPDFIPALTNPPLFQEPPQQSPVNWYLNNLNQQNIAKPWDSCISRSEAPNYGWHSIEPSNHHWGNYTGHNEATICFDQNWVNCQLTLMTPPPPPPAPPTVQYPGFGVIQNNYLNGQAVQPLLYQGYGYPNFNFPSPWGFQNINSTMQPM